MTVVDDPNAWRPPLPPLVLAEATEPQKDGVRECLETHRVQQPDVRADELLAAARCVGALSLPGHEIRLYEHLLATFPESAEAVEASREVGLRLEQADALAPALESYDASTPESSISAARSPRASSRSPCARAWRSRAPRVTATACSTRCRPRVRF